MALRGAFSPVPEDHVPEFSDGSAVATLVLLGWTGGLQWPAFRVSPEAADGRPHPLDRWSRRLIDAAAAALGAMPLYPFGGPPYRDFQGWALRAEPVIRSPIGFLVHPDWGLWHSYRGALGFRQHLASMPAPGKSDPCERCAGQPCLSSCPVEAFSARGYDVAACSRHLTGPAGTACLGNSCAARRACPIRPKQPYSVEQSAFHMRAFMQAQWDRR